MNNSYEDIRYLIPTDPKWWDENAVPRYCNFSPQESADTYCDQCALVLIKCQNCRHEFKVCMSSNNMDKYLGDGEFTLKNLIDRGELHYGDPPNISCCPAGPSMSCEDIKVLEFWERKNFEWVRNPQYEIVLPDSELPLIS